MPMSKVVKHRKPRLMVVGARGFLGRFVCEVAEAEFTVIRADRTLRDAGTDVLLDLVDPGSIGQAFREASPDAVVLLAAISDIDRCERKPEEEVAVNLTGAVNVARACAAVGACLLFTSTGAVFDGKKLGYSEADPVSPLSIYGRTKADAEREIQAIVPDAIILRVSLVLGRTGNHTTNSVVDNLIARWNRGEVVNASTVESRNPIDARTLAMWIVELLLKSDGCGIYNAGSTDAWTRFQIAAAMAERLHFPESLVQPQLSASTLRAPRGLHQLLLPDKIRRVCSTPPPNTEGVIERSLHAPAQGGS